MRKHLLERLTGELFLLSERHKLLQLVAGVIPASMDVGHRLADRSGPHISPLIPEWLQLIKRHPLSQLFTGYPFQ